jgi:hypothetical protein
MVNPFMIGMVDVAQGQQLDRIGEMYGIKRRDCPAEPDDFFRRRILEEMQVIVRNTFPATMTPEELDFKMEYNGNFVSHDGHEVVENWAGGKRFMYCRKCKVEV